MLLLLSNQDSDVAIPPGLVSDAGNVAVLASLYSGIILNQNAPTDYAQTVAGTMYQDFSLPSDFTRGDEIIPPLTGFQLFADVADLDLAIDWAIECYIVGTGWQSLASGTTTGAPFVGHQWINIFLSDPISVPESLLTNRYRIKATLSGASLVYYSVPNPLASVTTLADTRRAYRDGNPTLSAGANPILDAFREVSLRFRILAGIVDSGTDFLGNQYRSVAVEQTLDNASTVTGARNEFWLSGPQPSQFAVVSTYHDLRQNEQPSVVDRVLIDPVTPNVYFHLYYSNDEVDPTGFTSDDWDGLLWTHVPATFKATRRETHALPAPVSARFFKIEFSHLQARPYSPGDFQKPISYNKHPKWVLDYFLLRSEVDNPTDDHFIANSVAVTFDALDFAYNYYLDDLRQNPNPPVQLASNDDTVKRFLNTLDDSSEAVDQTTLSRIQTTFNEWQSEPSSRGKQDYLPTLYTRSISDEAPGTYPTESVPSSLITTTSSVSRVDREPVVVEQGFPVMFYFITCRHFYRKVQAPLPNGRAYFVGVREIQFDRDLYSATADQAVYTDILSDGINAERNDFLHPTFSAQIVRT